MANHGWNISDHVFRTFPHFSNSSLSEEAIMCCHSPLVSLGGEGTAPTMTCARQTPGACYPPPALGILGPDESQSRQLEPKLEKRYLVENTLEKRSIPFSHQLGPMTDWVGWVTQGGWWPCDRPQSDPPWENLMIILPGETNNWRERPLAEVSCHPYEYRKPDPGWTRTRLARLKGVPFFLFTVWIKTSD